MKTKTSLGTSIREARTAKGLTLDRLAEALDTTRQVIINWEQGKHRPQPRHRARLAEVLGRPDLAGAEREEEE